MRERERMRGLFLPISSGLAHRFLVLIVFLDAIFRILMLKRRNIPIYL